ncbi:hemolysin family protein [Desulforhabdus amnigena]|jgi:CBS domain containing-hemolysin-like protein|uniref:Hemolysin n=1 Tax=Desulforhabdus amnigena TaxID=40218 RepID=A0A9W6FUI6_9BACT|nr:hemolysin family protein [Desulforhabdus amnigena]NLJ27616.1 HlyC/CorC family transporter [Deltaproteobacteria bacterium]GLI35141.1 hemolysin [Desulforhabdus amnigena]
MFAACIIIFFLIVINALYVAAEFAAVGVRKSRIRQMAEEGSSLAKLFLPWLVDPHKLDQYIAACQIGITLSSLILGAYGQETLAAPLAGIIVQWGGVQEVAAYSAASLSVLIFLTTLQVILGELVPKSIALQYSTQAALLSLFPMRWSLTVFSWLIAILNGSALIILKIFGVKYGVHRHVHSPEEIEMLITESRDGGVLEADEHQRLQRALQLGKRPAHQLMVPRRYMSGIDVELPMDQVMKQIAESPYSHLPVYRGSMDNVIGIVHVKEVAIHYIEKGTIGSITEIMRPLMSVPENVTADALLNLLRQRRSHQAMVVDEFGGTEGLVTLEDVLTEMLGEVADEFKLDQPQPERLPDGRVRLPGLMRLDMAEPWLGVLWQGDADTISGHVMEVLGTVPVARQRVTIDGVEVEIEQVAHHAIVSILARPVRPVEEDVHG